MLVVLNIVSGAAVRLTDSGLGCPDWPTCSVRSITPTLSFHPAMEFGNRMVVVALSVLVVATVVAAALRRPGRRDLGWLSAGLLAGVVGEAVLGGVVVYTKLNPYAVMTHFMVGIALLTVALVLAIRAGGGVGAPRRAAVGAGVRRLAYSFTTVTLVAICAGTATTGAGPHAGGAKAVRLPVPLDDMARTHSGLVLVAAALLLCLLLVLHRSRANRSLQDRAQLVLAAVVGQGVIGYVQFFLHLPALLVGIHVLGATLVWCATVWLLDAVRRPAAGPGIVELVPATASVGAGAVAATR